MGWPLAAPPSRGREGSDELREDCSRKRRIRAEERGVFVWEREGELGRGWRNLGRESLTGCFCLRLKESLGVMGVSICTLLGGTKGEERK